MSQPRYWDGPQTAYVDGNDPKAKADDLNGLQQDESDLWRAFRHAEFDVSDDFAGLTTYQWGTVLNATLIGAEANANGTVDIVSAGAAGQVSTLILNRFGTRDFYFSARLRVITFAGSQTKVGCDGSPYFFIADATVDAANWRVFIGGLSVAVGPPVDATFREFEIYRFGGIVYFRVDGAVIYSVADSSNVAGKTWGTICRKFASDGDIRLDRQRLTIFGTY